MAASVFPSGYEEKVYAGVLGKMIGVYLGRPFEGWRYERIMEQLGPIRYYVHERLGKPLVVSDDDLSGTFTFVRALEDFSCAPGRAVTADQIGKTWLNYIIENKTVLWWGGMGASTEHTAFQRLKHGVEAPKSGCIALNGKVVAEQIGSQIFIDGWAMAAPGDPERAAAWAREAASVSHDGEAIYGAQAIAAMEAQAFVEPEITKLLDTAVRFIPPDCTIRRLIGDLREWKEADGAWEKTRARIQDEYGYEKFGGCCHIVPNHAVIILALLYGGDDFQESLKIANTAGWDTDCNSGNVGCLLGIKNGLAGIEAGPDWRQPVADRLYLPTADGGGCVTDAARVALSLCRAGRAAAGEPSTPPKDGARFHFEFPGSVQGFRFESSPECRGVGTLWNAEGHSQKGSRSLAIGYAGLAEGRAARAATPTFLSAESAQMPGYGMVACPSLYPGQTVKAAVEADAKNSAAVRARLYVRYFDAGDEQGKRAGRDERAIMRGEEARLEKGARRDFSWRVPDNGGRPIGEVGIEITSAPRAHGTVYLDYLTWEGAPELNLGLDGESKCGQRAWVAAADRIRFGGRERPYTILQDEGMGLLIQGAREWAGYRLDAPVNIHMGRRAGVAVCVQGLKRYYALLLCRDQKIRLVKEYYGERVLAEADYPWALDEWVGLALSTNGGVLEAHAGGKKILEAEDREAPLRSGAIALVCEEGRAAWGAVRVTPRA